MKFRLILLTVCLLVLNACVSTDKVYVKKSIFDNSTSISMDTVSIMRSDFGFRLYANTKMPKDTIILKAVVFDTSNIDSNNSLKFNIDGDIVTLSTSDDSTIFETVLHYETYRNEASRSYEITPKLIERIVNSKRTVARIELSNSYVEGIVVGNEYKALAAGNKFFNIKMPQGAFRSFLTKFKKEIK